MASSNATLRFLDYPWQIVETVFDFSIRARTLKRAMRLRFVSKGFCHQTNEAIFRSRILTKLDKYVVEYHWSIFWFNGKNKKRERDIAMCSFFLELYGNPRNFPEDDPASPGFQIRRVTQRICELTGGLDHVTFESYMRRLCYSCLHFNLIFTDDEIINGVQETTRSEDNFDAAVLDAACFLNLLPVVKQLLENRVLRYRGSGEMNRLRMTSYLGHSEIFQYLFSIRSIDPDDTAYEQALIAMSFRGAGLGGSSQMFNYMLNLFTTTSLRSSINKLTWNDNRRKCKIAMWNAITPEDYQSGIQKLMSAFNIDASEFHEDFQKRVNYAIRNRRPELLKYFLNQISSVSSVALMGDLQWRRTRGTGVPTYHYDPMSSTLADELLRKALHHSLKKASSRSEAAVKLLLEHGADPNLFDSEDTPLMRAVNAGCYDIVCTLIESGAHVDFGTPPPIALAVKQENMTIFRYLRLKGAALDTPESGGWAMASAKSYRLDSMVEVLVSEGVEESAVLHRVRCSKECSMVRRVKSVATGAACWGYGRYGFGIFEYNPKSNHLATPYTLPLECWDEFGNPSNSADA